jgi:hypothetical protein
VTTSGATPVSGPQPGRRRGAVTAFDDHVGLGEVTDGAGTWAFHCTQLADGSRTVEVGTPVDYEVRPVHAGRLEAFDLRRC